MQKLNRLLLGLVLALALGAAAPVRAATPAAAGAGPHVVVNGQHLIALGHLGPHIHNNRLYAAVADFAWLTGATWNYNTHTGTLTINGKAISYDWTPAPHFHGDHLYAPVRVMAEAVRGTVQWDPASGTAYVIFAGKTPAQVLGLPRGVSRLTGVLPTIGERWGDPATMPFGPTYLVYGERVIGWEIHVSRAELDAGRSWPTFVLARTGNVDHAELHFQPNGHDGFAVPHYDLHAYTITVDQQRAIR